MTDLVSLAQELIDHYPKKAVELLVFYLQDDVVRAATERFIGRQGASSGRADTALEQHQKSLPTRWHHRKPSMLYEANRQNVQTPPHSAGSVKSNTSGMAAQGAEKIYFLSGDDEGPGQPAISRSAPGKYNLITEKVAYRHGLGDGQFRVDESVPVHNASGGPIWVKATFAVNLVWRRCTELTTEMDTFHIVPGQLLKSDVILGTDGSPEHQSPAEFEEVRSPQVRYQQGHAGMDNFGPAIPPPVPTVPMYTYPQSYLPPSHDVQRTYDRAQAMRDSQRTHIAQPTGPSAQLRPTSRGQPTPTNNPLDNQEGTMGQLYVGGLWDKTPIKMSLNPSDTGEAFYQAFHQWAVDRKSVDDLDRQRVTLMLKANKNAPDDEAYELGLEESELEMLWEAAVEWIQENKNPKAPHIFATVKIKAG
ncbi:unnamed protein product [Alternaria alternata]